MKMRVLEGRGQCVRVCVYVCGYFVYDCVFVYVCFCMRLRDGTASWHRILVYDELDRVSLLRVFCSAICSFLLSVFLWGRNTPGAINLYHMYFHMKVVTTRLCTEWDIAHRMDTFGALWVLVSFPASVARLPSKSAKNPHNGWSDWNFNDGLKTDHNAASLT